MLDKQEREDIEEIKKMLNFTTNETSLRINNKVSKLLLKYMKDLEQTNEILDKECSRLEEKEIILHKTTDKLKEMKQTINKLKNRDGESMLMVDVCIQNIIAFYDDFEKIMEGEKN